MYIEMENVIQKKYVYIDKCSGIIMQKMHTHTHTHTLYRLMGVKDNVV